MKCGGYLLGPSLAAALPAEQRVSARWGWVGEKSELFEHPAGVLSCCTTIVCSQAAGFSDTLPSFFSSLADSNKTYRIADQCRRVVPLPNPVGHSIPVAPLGNPQDFFRGRRDKARPRKLAHTTCNQRTHNAALLGKLQRIEGERIASSVRQRRQMWESLRVIQHTDHPEMIESALRAGRINRMEREGDRATDTIEGCDFGLPKIMRFYRPAQFCRFHNQCRKFRHSGTDIETAPAPCELPPQHRGDSTSRDRSVWLSRL